ncbi:hypothetical protein OQY15_01730 [Pedobacter sp. MC2016-15]|uniref:hypothetical protein n=1 Tax=Pedobacter sp. MC2016-15 TaxID=2994473 RepID=UPI0022459F1D|nr:hypothetical protein [Pedobacter sp. MC2016-15]MCX2477789.1 hypothetical protein [Pedobacter sp. MC2016-15]
MNKIRILEVGNELGLGGTEYVIQLFSQFLDKEYFQVTVLGLKEGGVRAQIIEEMGTRVIILNGEYEKLAEHLRNTDVLHWHGDGSLDPKLFSIVQANRPKLVIQTNVFGLHTRSSLYDCIDYDLYVSKMILIRRMLLDQDL